MLTSRIALSVHRAGAASCLAVLATIGVIACGDTMAVTEPPKVPLVICYQPLVVTADVSASGAPRFSWSPACGATYFEVTSPDHQQVFWIVQGDTGRVAPGVTYGVAPGGYESRLGPLRLEPGRSYAVRVGVMVEEDSFFIMGEGVFTR